MENKDNNIRKGHQLINAQIGKLDIRSARILNIAMLQIKSSDKKFNTFKIPIKEIVNKSNNFNRKVKNEKGDEVNLIDIITDNLMSEIIKIEEKDGWTKFNFLSECSYFKNTGYLKVKFSSKMKKHLLDVDKKYIKLDFEIMHNLKTHYSMRLYEIIKYHHDISYKTKKNYVEFNIIELQSMIGAEGSYNKWNLFRDKILKHAQKNFKQNSDLIFTFKAWAKYGRAFNTIILYFEKNTEYCNENLNDINKLETVTVNDQPSILKKLTEKFGLSEIYANKCIEYSKKKYGKNWENAVNLKLKKIYGLYISGTIKVLNKYTFTTLMSEDNKEFKQEVKKEISRINKNKNMNKIYHNEQEKKIKVEKEKDRLLKLVNSLDDDKNKRFMVYISKKGTNIFNKKFTLQNRLLNIEGFLEEEKKNNIINISELNNNKLNELVKGIG